jgi:hypothetical protein
MIWMIVAAILLAAGALYFGLPQIRPEMHLVLSKWCHGVSTGKIGYFLVMMLGGLVYFIARESTVARRAGATSLQPTHRGMMVLAPLLVGWLGTLVSNWWYQEAFVLQMRDVSYHWLAGLPSVNSIQHIHTSKAPLASGLDLIGLSHLHARFDTGAAYAAVIPAWMQWWIGGSFVIAIVSGLVASGRVVDRFAPHQRAAAGLAWLIGWVCGTKCILDGGPLGYDALLSFALLAGACAMAAGFSWPRIRASLVIAASLWLVTHLLLDVEGALSQSLRLIERAAWIGLLLVTVLRVSAPRDMHPSPGWVTWRVAVAFGVVVGGTLWISYQSEVAPLRQVVKEASITQLTSQDDGVWFRPVSIESASTGGACLDCAEAYRILGDQPSRVRRISMAHRRPPGATGMHVDIRPVGPAADAKFTSRGDVELRGIEPVPDVSGTWLKMELGFAAGRGPVVVDGWGQRGQMLENERFIAMLAADAFIQQAGIREYVMVPRGFFALRVDTQTPRPSP